MGVVHWVRGEWECCVLDWLWHKYGERGSWHSLHQNLRVLCALLW